MKTNCISLLAAALLLGSQALHAESQVPLRISYQGIVSTGGSNLIGAGTPVNREVIFKVWDHASDPTQPHLLYAESQIVTISEGEFSVLVGGGAVVTGLEAFGPGTVSLGDVFKEVPGHVSSRFLGVTVDDDAAQPTSAADDVEISPRQQIVATAFTLRALQAESLVDNSITEANLMNDQVSLDKLKTDSVDSTKIKNGEVKLDDLATDSVDSTKIKNGEVKLDDLATGSVDSSKIVNGSVDTIDLKNGAVTQAKLGSDVGAWDTTGGNAYRTSGYVGIGTSSVSDLLTLGSTGFCALSFNTPDNAVAGIQWHRFGDEDYAGIYFAGDSSMKFSGGGNLTRMIITQAGFVGIGTNTPSHLLHVNGVARSTQSSWATSSDRRVKENIHPLKGSLRLLERLQPVTFDYKEPYRKLNPGMDGTHAGFIAQEIGGVFPEMVTKIAEQIDEKGTKVEDFHVLNTGELLPRVIGAVQELGAAVKERDEKIAALEAKIAAIEAALKSGGVPAAAPVPAVTKKRTAAK